jgi:hypothetical protein
MTDSETSIDEPPTSGPSQRTPHASVSRPSVRFDGREAKRYARRASRQNRLRTSVFGQLLITLLVIVGTLLVEGSHP